MRQLPNPSNSQNCLWDWKCPYSSNVPYTRILHSSRYSGNLTGMVLLAPILMNQGIFMLVAGFFRLRKDLPKAVWRYPMSYISFHTYALQVLLIPNTYSNLKQPISIPSHQMSTQHTIKGGFFLAKLTSCSLALAGHVRE